MSNAEMDVTRTTVELASNSTSGSQVTDNANSKASSNKLGVEEQVKESSEAKIAATGNNSVDHSTSTTHDARAFPPFDSTYFPSHIFWLVVSFGLFYLFISRVILPRFDSIIGLRRKTIEENLKEATESKEKADALIKSFQELSSAAKVEARDIATQAITEARVSIQQKRQSVEKSLKEELTKRINELDSARSKAMSNVEAMVKELSLDMVHKVLNNKTIGSDKISDAIKNLKIGEKL